MADKFKANDFKQLAHLGKQRKKVESDAVYAASRIKQENLNETAKVTAMEFYGRVLNNARAAAYNGETEYRSDLSLPSELREEDNVYINELRRLGEVDGFLVTMPCERSSPADDMREYNYYYFVLSWGGKHD